MEEACLQSPAWGASPEHSAPQGWWEPPIQLCTRWSQAWGYKVELGKIITLSEKDPDSLLLLLKLTKRNTQQQHNRCLQVRVQCRAGPLPSAAGPLGAQERLGPMPAVMPRV